MNSLKNELIDDSQIPFWKRKNLLEAEKERRIYEKLKDRDQKLYMSEQKKEQRKHLDQVGERMHNQKLSMSKNKMEGTSFYDGIN